MDVTPVFVSPFINAQFIGAAPLYFGSSEAWRFIHPYRGKLSISLGRICPNATTTIQSGLYSHNFFIKSGSLTFSGCNTSILLASATTRFASLTASFTGEGSISLPLPFGLSGWVTTAIILWLELIIPSNVETAKSGVPINIIFIKNKKKIINHRWTQINTDDKHRCHSEGKARSLSWA